VIGPVASRFRNLGYARAVAEAGVGRQVRWLHAAGSRSDLYAGAAAAEAPDRAPVHGGVAGTRTLATTAAKLFDSHSYRALG
jgi:hypothetical protein